MKVYPIHPRGYCKGVVRAIALAKDCLKKDYPKPIYILGMIVHNRFVVESLKKEGIETIDCPGKSRLALLDEIHQGTIIITAHGASPAVFQKAQRLGLTILDATCLDVIKTHDLIKHYLQCHRDILYIGKKGHPEAEGALGIDPEHIFLIEKKEDIDHLKDRSRPYVLTNQTTMSLYDVYDLCQYAKERLDDLIIEKEICDATSVRQKAICQIPEEVDIIFVVGDPHSHNSTKLASIAQEKAKREVHMIENVTQIDPCWLKDKHYAAITSGASTPAYLTNEVIHYLEQYHEKK